LEIDPAVFVPDADPSTTTNPTLADSDGDGRLDGEEDVNANGCVDPGERDPNAHDNVTDAKAMPWIPYCCWKSNAKCFLIPGDRRCFH
jgi:hypothetical protein